MWLGSTKAAVRPALAELEAVAATLDRGATGWRRGAASWTGRRRV